MRVSSRYIPTPDFFPHRNVISIVSIASMNDFPGLKPELLEKQCLVKALAGEGEQNHA
jgi:hypothetical protein